MKVFQIGLEIFTNFFESLNQHKKLKMLSLIPLEDFKIEYLKVIQKYLSINNTLKDFLIYISSIGVTQKSNCIMTILESLYINNTLNKLIISRFERDSQLNLKDLFLYNHSLTEFSLNGSKNEEIENFLLRNIFFYQIF